jgi:hypothetical protein
VNTIKIATVLSIMAALGLCGCVEPKIPVGDDPGYPPKVAQVLDIYAEYVKSSGKTVGVTEGVRDLDVNIKINQTRPLTRAEVIKLLEQDLRDQAGVVVVHRDRRHIIFGLSGNADQRPAFWISPAP